LGAAALCDQPTLLCPPPSPPSLQRTKRACGARADCIKATSYKYSGRRTRRRRTRHAWPDSIGSAGYLGLLESLFSDIGSSLAYYMQRACPCVCAMRRAAMQTDCDGNENRPVVLQRNKAQQTPRQTIFQQNMWICQWSGPCRSLSMVRCVALSYFRTVVTRPCRHLRWSF
jgi:hypothetical protein